MTITLILFAVQALVTVFALFRKSSADARFAEDKLEFRS
jgi:hypothetical protein